MHRAGVSMKTIENESVRNQLERANDRALSDVSVRRMAGLSLIDVLFGNYGEVPDQLMHEVVKNVSGFTVEDLTVDSDNGNEVGGDNAG